MLDCEEFGPHLPVLALGNKMDLPNAMTVEELKTAFDMSGLRNRPWRVQLCSVLRQEGVTEALDWLIAAVGEQRKERV